MEDNSSIPSADWYKQHHPTLVRDSHNVAAEKADEICRLNAESPNTDEADSSHFVLRSR